MARFATYTVGSQVIVLPKGLKFEYPERARGQLRRHLVAAKLKKLRIAPSGICDDEVFLRRVYLDIVGLPPTVEEYNRFMASTDPDKRAKLIDELLERKEFSEIWVNKWAELLQVKSSHQVSYKAMFLYYNWLVEKLSKNMPMDQMVQELLGRQRRHVQEPGDQLLPGRPTETLPLDRERRPGLHGHADPVRPVPQPPVRPLDPERLLRLRRLLRADRPQAGRGLSRDDRLQLRRRRGAAPGRRPGDEAQVPGRRRRPTSPARTAASSWPKWLASPENPWFATSFANRVWAHFMGSGIVEPVDDFRVSNPASNPELLEELGKRFTDSKYDLKTARPRHLQLADLPAVDRAEREQRDRRAELRPRQPPPDQGREPARHDQRGDRHQGQVPGPPPRCPGRADRRRQQLDLLPDHLRPRHPRDGLLVRGEDGADALAGPPPAQRRHRQRQDPARRRDPEADRRPRSSPRSGSSSSTSAPSRRKPTSEELDKLLPVLGEGSNQKQALEDIFWALLNSREFLFNH